MKFRTDVSMMAQWLVLFLALIWMVVVIFFWGAVLYLVYLVLKHIGLIGLVTLM
jgi:hypothetical protein